MFVPFVHSGLAPRRYIGSVERMALALRQDPNGPIPVPILRLQRLRRRDQQRVPRDQAGHVAERGPESKAPALQATPLSLRDLVILDPERENSATDTLAASDISCDIGWQLVANDGHSAKVGAIGRRSQHLASERLGSIGFVVRVNMRVLERNPTLSAILNTPIFFGSLREPDSLRHRCDLLNAGGSYRPSGERLPGVSDICA